MCGVYAEQVDIYGDRIVRLVLSEIFGRDYQQQGRSLLTMWQYVVYWSQKRTDLRFMCRENRQGIQSQYTR